MLSVSLASKVPGSPKNQLLLCCDKWIINSSLVYIRCSLTGVTAGSVDGVLLYTDTMFIQVIHTLLYDQSLSVLAVHT